MKDLCGSMEYDNWWFFVLLGTGKGERDNVGGSNRAGEVKQGVRRDKY